MAGSPNGKLMSAVAAKERLLDLGRKESMPAKLLGSPVVRAGALLVAGAFLGRMLGRRDKGGAAASLRSTVLRAGMAAAPFLVQQFARAMTDRPASHNGRPAEPSVSEPGRR